MIWRRRKKRGTKDVDAFVERERAEAEAARHDTRRQVAEARALRAESSRVHAKGQKIQQENGFTTWMMQLLRGVQEDGR